MTHEEAIAEALLDIAQRRQAVFDKAREAAARGDIMETHRLKGKADGLTLAYTALEDLADMCSP